MKKRFFSIVLMLVMTLTVLATANAEEKVNLRFAWWGSDSRNALTTQVVENYMAANPNVVIEPEYTSFDSYQDKLITQIATGTAPDIFQLVDRWFYDFTGEENHLYDISTLTDSIDLSKFDQDFLEVYCSVDGNLVGLPNGIGGYVFLVNKDFFDKFDIPLDTQWTWENILEIGERVHEQDPECYLLGTDHQSVAHLCYYYAKQLTGDKWIKDDKTFSLNEEQLTEILAWVDRLYNQGTAEPMSTSALYTSKTAENPKWIAGSLGMSFQATSALNPMINAGEFSADHFTVMALPQMDNPVDKGCYAGSTNLMAINQNTKYPEEAAKFLDYFYNTVEAGAILGTDRGMPANNEVRETLVAEGIITQMDIDALDIVLANASGIVDNGTSQDTELEAITYSIVEAVAYGQLSPEDGAKSMIAQFEDRLSQLR